MSEHVPLTSLPLFAGADTRPPAPFQPKSPTSRAAGVSRTRASMASKRERVLRAIAAAGADGRTCSEVAEELLIPAHWITSSIARLLELGAIEDAGRERENPASGKKQRVLVARGQA